MTKTSPPSGAVHDPTRTSSRQLNIISMVLVLGVITTLLDTTIVNIALNHLQETFNSSVANSQWLVTAYLLAYVAVIPVSGWASERFGARRVWMCSVGVFALGSLLCGLAWSLPSLIVFRVVQGLGAGMILPVTITILTRAAGKDRIGRAIATIGLLGQLAPILGPVIGGTIIDSVGWHWLFLVNLPLCLAALLLAPKFLPRSEFGGNHPLDVVGFLLLTPGVVALAYGISSLGSTGGFTSPNTWLPMTLGVAAILAFTLRSLHAKAPTLVDARVFARRSFGIGSIITFAGGFSVYALMFLLPLFYQQIRGNTVFVTGLLLIPQGVGTMVFILLSRRLPPRIDTRLVIASGVIIAMIGILPFALDGIHGNNVVLLAAQFMQGFGMAAVSLPVMTVAFASLTPEEMPRGSAAFSIVQRVGAPFGVTVVAVILQHFMSSIDNAQAFSATFWWIFAFCAIPLVLALFLPSSRGNATAEPAPHSSAKEPAPTVAD